MNESFGRQASLSSQSTYTFKQFHFHWPANSRIKGSEHSINGSKDAAELHLVHFKSKYGNMNEAVNHTDGLLVLTVLLKLDTRNNSNLTPLIANLTNILNINQNISFEISLQSLLPRDQNLFYVYSGSLTTPDCNEVATFVIFADKIPISQYQLSKFQKIMVKAPGFDTVRDIQPRNGRTIYISSANQCN